MWRDPLDELIDMIETALPADTNRHELLPRLADLQMVMSPILFGSEKDRERIEADPLYHKVMAQLAERAKRCTHK
jgi:hypothetical protein